MITGSHLIIHSRDAEADRAFLRDVLQLAHVDVGAGWLIFRLPPAEVALHPTEGSSRHELFLMCDDLQVTMQELAARGVEFTAPVSRQRWGALTGIRLPGGGEIGLYQPYHERAPQAGTSQG